MTNDDETESGEDDEETGGNEFDEADGWSCEVLPLSLCGMVVVTDQGHYSPVRHLRSPFTMELVLPLTPPVTDVSGPVFIFHVGTSTKDYFLSSSLRFRNVIW